MRFFTRSARWRQVFFAACLPYMLVSVLVESLHTTPVGQQEPSAAVETLGGHVSAALSSQTTPCIHPISADDSCPACNWLRLGRRIEGGITLVRTREVTLEALAPAPTAWPDSPVPHPALFRGPPRPTLS